MTEVRIRFHVSCVANPVSVALTENLYVSLKDTCGLGPRRKRRKNATLALTQNMPLGLMLSQCYTVRKCIHKRYELDIETHCLKAWTIKSLINHY